LAQRGKSSERCGSSSVSSVVPVAMVNVRGMRVIVHQRSMPMPVRMRLAVRIGRCVLVLLVRIVRMQMVVLGRKMLVQVRVPLA
jgi:hypothetical protein